MPSTVTVVILYDMYYPSERSELRYGVWGLGFHVIGPLSPPRGFNWEGYKALHMVKVSVLHVLG